MKKSVPTIYTLGHSNRPFWVFRLKLLQNNIDLVVDVRTIPRSRYCPHFSKNALQEGLWEKRIKYLWLGDSLGGRGINKNYEGTVNDVSNLVKGGIRACLVCSEANPEECHRHSMLRPSFEECGLKVVHILYDKEHRQKATKGKQSKLL